MNNRRHHALLALLLFTMIGSVGCTTTRTVTASSPEALIERQIKVGDKVTVRFAPGHSETIKLTKIGQEFYTGTARNGRVIELDYDNRFSLKYKELDKCKTARATVGLVLVGAALVGALPPQPAVDVLMSY